MDDISVTVCLFVFVFFCCSFVCLYGYGFSAVDWRPRQGITHLGEILLPQKPKIVRIGQRAGHAHRDVRITVEMRQRKRHARDAPFVEYRAACGRRIGMCG